MKKPLANTPKEAPVEDVEYSQNLFDELVSKYGQHFTVKYNSARQRRKMNHEEAVKFCAEWFSKQK